MSIELIAGILQIILIATTPLVFAGIGELVTEKSGVLNLVLRSAGISPQIAPPIAPAKIITGRSQNVFVS